VDAALLRRRRLVEGLGQSLLATGDAVNPVSYLQSVEDDGFWRATRERAEAAGQQAPAVALTVATSGIGAGAAAVGEMTAAAKVLSGLGAAAKATIGPGNFDPRYVAEAGIPRSALDARTQSLTIAVDGDGGHRVGLDPATGDFVVNRSTGDGVEVTEKRWSRLADDEQDELRDRGIVNEKGGLIGTGG
jgi:hypothetical protein